MTPQRRSEFENQWPELARRLEFFLVRSGVHGDMRDDVIQDTALRLYGMWMRVENDRSAWPLTKTIALNLVRDASRRRGSVEIEWEVPDLPAPHDVESSGIARIELGRIEKALGEMSAAHRSLILEEVGGEAAPTATSPAAEKMMRMRARKRLIALLEKVSALIPGRNHLVEWGSSLFTAREGLAGGFACLLCVVLGTGLVIAPGATAPAKARPQRIVTAPAIDGERAGASTASTALGLDSALRDAYDFTSAVRRTATKSSSTSASTGAGAGGEGAAGEAPGSEPLPLPEDVPDTGVYVSPDSVDDVAPPPPDTPETKTGLEEAVDDAVETADELLESVNTDL